MKKNNKCRKLSVYFLSLMLLISLLLYLSQPVRQNVSMKLFYCIFGLAVISNIIYFKTKNKSNYLDFDSLFIFISCLIGFSTTFFYKDPVLYRALFLGFPVSELFINRGNLLVLIGLQCYMIGNLSIPCLTRERNQKKIIGTVLLKIFLVMFLGLFIMSGGLSYYKSKYTNNISNASKGLSVHFLILAVCVSITLIATEIYNKRNNKLYRIRKKTVFAMVVFIFMLMSAGNRTSASMIILPLLCFYSMFYFNVHFKHFVIFLLLSVSAMWIFQNIRGNYEIQLSAPIMLIQDLTIPSRQLYAALEYVASNDYTLGKSMSIGVISTIPFYSAVLPNGNTTEFGSAEKLTEYTNIKYNIPQNNRIGLGTTIITDLYLSFGLLGVIIFMFLLGVFINIIVRGSLNNDYYSFIILSAMFANSVYITRASYTHPIRYIVWTLLLSCLNLTFTRYTCKVKIISKQNK